MSKREEYFVLHQYSVDQAVQDGVLIDLVGNGLAAQNAKIGYVTRTVWDHFVRKLQGVVDVTYLRRIVETAEHVVRRRLVEKPDEWFVEVAGPYVAALGENGKWVLMHKDDY